MTDQTIFMGDFVAASDIAIELNGSITVNITSGSWFASALELWKYLIYAYNDYATTTVTVGMSDTGVITMTHGGASFTVVVSTGSSAEFLAALGLSLVTEMQSGAAFVTLPVSNFFAPVFPLATYSIGTFESDGYTARASNGLVYSMQGIYQEYRELSVAFDYTDATHAELETWRNLVYDRLAIGRSVCLFLDSGQITAVVPTGVNVITAGESLVLPAPPETLASNRIVLYSEDTLLTGDDLKFAVRRHFPYYEAQSVAWELV